MTAQPDTSTLPFSLDRPASKQEAENFCSALSGTMEALLSVIEMETDLVRAGKLKEAGELHLATLRPPRHSRYAVSMANSNPCCASIWRFLQRPAK